MAIPESLCSICPSTIISYLRSLEASLGTSASRSTAGPIVFSLDRNKPVTSVKLSNFKELYLSQFLSDLDDFSDPLIRITYVILSPLLVNGAP